MAVRLSLTIIIHLIVVSSPLIKNKRIQGLFDNITYYFTPSVLVKFDFKNRSTLVSLKEAIHSVADPEERGGAKSGIDPKIIFSKQLFLEKKILNIIFNNKFVCHSPRPIRPIMNCTIRPWIQLIRSL